MSDKGWICPKCGRVYGPITTTCYPCNAAITERNRQEYERRSFVKPINL